jgi:hypothetical protein
MACWPTIVATVPSGPDLLDFKTDPSLKHRADKSVPTSAGPPEDLPGAFVTEVFMSPADVYCEWTPLATPLEYPFKLTLWQAIAQAKEDRALSRGRLWRPAARSLIYILGAVAVGGLAGVAVTTCTPSGRRLVLATAKRLAASFGETDNNAADAKTAGSFSSGKQIIDGAAAGVTTKESFFSRLGRIALPTHSLTLSSLRSLGRIRKPRTIVKRTLVRETRRANSRSAAAGIYDWLPFRATPFSDLQTSSSGNRWGFPFVAVGTRSVTTGLGRGTTEAVPQPTATQGESFASKVAQKLTSRDRPGDMQLKPPSTQWSPVGVLNRIPGVWDWYTGREH